MNKPYNIRISELNIFGKMMIGQNDEELESGFRSREF